ncbi:hypothetical protein D1872_266150 [compost metagenome]
MSPVNEDIDESPDDRGHGKGQIDQRHQQLFPAKMKFGDRPSRGYAEDRVQRNGDNRHQQSQP